MKHFAMDLSLFKNQILVIITESVELLLQGASSRL